MKKHEYNLKQLGLMAKIRLFPFPEQIVSIGLLLVIGILGVGFFPQIVDHIVMNWVPKEVDNRTLFLGASFSALLFFTTTMVLLFFGGPANVFLRARLMKRDVLELMTTSGKKVYKTPSEEVGGVWGIGKDLAVEIDSNSFYSGPGGVRMTTAIPELPITFNPRKLVEGYGLGLDMMTLKTYGIKHEQKQWEKMKSGKEWIQPFLMPLIILLVIGLLIGPWFYGKMGQVDEAKEWRQQYEACRVEMLDAGVTPDNMKPKEEPKNSDGTKPATTGMELK